MAHYLTTQFVQLPRMQTESEKCAQSGCCCCCLTDAPATEIGAKMSPGCTPWICIDHRQQNVKFAARLSTHQSGFNVSLAI